MYSAFGVEHEFSKGRIPFNPQKLAAFKAARKAGNSAYGIGAQAAGAAKHSGGTGIVHGPSKDPHPIKSLKDDLRFVTIGPKKKKAL